MRAVGLTAWGGPDVLHVIDLPDPVAGPGEVLVRVEFAGVAPVDVMARGGLLARMYAGQEPPFVPGMEIAGIVEAVGEGAPLEPGVEVGSSVVAFVDFNGAHGGYSERLALPAGSVVAAPTGLTVEQAATSVLNPLTARNALDTLGLSEGATLLVTGAGGAVGGYVVQLAAREGLQVVAQAAAADEDRVRGYGATWFVPRDAPLADAVRAVVPAGVDAVVDPAGIGLAAGEAVRAGGQIGALRPMTGEPGRNITTHFLNVRSRATDTPAIAALRDLVQDGVLDLRPCETLPASAAAEAHARIESGSVRGRIALDLNELR